MKTINFKKEWRAIVMIVATTIVSGISYAYLPARVVSHWNFYGQPDGFSSRELHCLLFPGIILGMYLMFLFLPKFDPKKDRYAEFSEVYRLMRDAIMFVLFGVFLVATAYNLGWPVPVGIAVSSLIGFLMIVMGNYFGKLKRNWFVGLRTPWALSSENVWNKTHRFGGRLFMIWGVLIILAPWLNSSWAMGILFFGIIFILIAVNVYSYLVFKKEKKA